MDKRWIGKWYKNDMGETINIFDEVPLRMKMSFSSSGYYNFHPNCVYEKDGYLYFDTNEVNIEFVMEPAFYTASQKVYECSGKAALMRGPIVYCLEGKDNDFSILNCRVDTSAPVTVSDESYGGYPILYAKGEIAEEQTALYAKVTNARPKEVTLKYIPFYTFANRGEDFMTVWVNKK